ncbi:oxidoreductase [Ectothiorhodospiraceae bacterium WFHF3C12]|nr:oxidoreductase [Ectothiorhodospiraceae bacterium WFHF3C12]
MSDQHHNQGTDPGPRLPPKPEPEPCCGSGCDPCVLEIYEEALERWERRCAQIRARYEAERRSREG